MDMLKSVECIQNKDNWTLLQFLLKKQIEKCT